MPTTRFGAGDKPPRYGKAVKWNERLRVRVKPIPCMLRQSLGETTSARMACGHSTACRKMRAKRNLLCFDKGFAQHSARTDSCLFRSPPYQGTGQALSLSKGRSTQSDVFMRQALATFGEKLHGRRIAEGWRVASPLSRCRLMTPRRGYSNVTSSVRTLSMVPPA